MQPFLNRFHIRSRLLQNHLAILHEHQSRPEFDAERSPKGLALAVLDIDIAHFRIFLEQSRQLRLEYPAIGSPIGAEFQQDGT